jgi:lipopolysaccharide transport system ATP-binding protein
MSSVISVQNVSKLYRLGQVGSGTLKDDLTRMWYRLRGKGDPFAQVGQLNQREETRTDGYVWALRDINLEVEQGEILGIIGRNGAGKSTLLKLLSRVTAPTEGEIQMQGRIASLLEVGTGFHPDLTGRENIDLNGTIMGMTRREIAARLDEIVEFSGCAKYIDTPVKRYSSGMKVRLGFAVAAHLECEILIVDEVLAVGDAEFQKKCLGKMQDVAEQGGRTILFVSHNMAAVENLCRRAVLLEQGKIASHGNCSTIIDEYLNLRNEDSPPGATLPAIRGVMARVDVEGMNKELCKPNRPVIFRVEVCSSEPLRHAHVVIGIEDHHGHRITTLHTALQTAGNYDVQERAVFEARWERLNLMPGTYWITLAILEGSSMRARWEHAVSFNVSDGDFYGTGRLPNPNSQGCVLTPITWTVDLDPVKGYDRTAS